VNQYGNLIMPNTTRRKTIAAVASGLTLGGCSQLQSPDETLDVTVRAEVSEGDLLDVNIFKEDVSDKSDSMVFDKSVSLSPDGTSEEQKTFEYQDILPPERYEVFVSVDGEVTSHHHYRPDCTSDRATRGPELVISVQVDPAYINFESGVCDP
jgi:hypothetical protein